MNADTPADRSTSRAAVRSERSFRRFSLSQRWEHAVLIISFTALLVTGLPQKYFEAWGHRFLTTPDSLARIRLFHHIFAIILVLEVIYHLGKALYLLARRRLSGSIFPNWQDVSDAGRMIRYLLLLGQEKPAFGKYNFEQKFTYWFLFLGLGIMVVTGLILWFPAAWTRVFPGGTIPAAQLAHSHEAVVAAIFVIVWHLYHVLFERLNLSIFTGRINERDLREHHRLEWERLSGETEVEEPGEGAR